MGPTLCTTSVCLVSQGEVVMEAGSQIISTFPMISQSASEDRPISESMRAVFPPPVAGASVRGEAVISSSVQAGLLTEAVCQVWPGAAVSRTCNKSSQQRSVCFHSPLYPLHMSLLVQPSGDRDPQLPCKCVRIWSKTSEADVNVMCHRSDSRKAEAASWLNVYSSSSLLCFYYFKRVSPS